MPRAKGSAPKKKIIYDDSWRALHDFKLWLMESFKGQEYGHCFVCNADFKVDEGTLRNMENTYYILFGVICTVI